MSATASAPRVALVGANGHGRWHRRQLAPRLDAGALRFAGAADPAPVDEPEPWLRPVFATQHELLSATRPDAVIICTPPRTHLALARDALTAGCAVLLEKPPVLSPAEHAELLAAGGRLQVGFQALGSLALPRLRAARADLGPLTGISVVAAWQRDDAYYARTPWAGRRDTDGALINPLAHAVMQCLAIAEDGGPPVRIEAERYRTRPIEADDTAFVRLTLAGGLPVLFAVTLSGEEFVPGEIVVSGTRGRAVLEYPTDRLTLPGRPTETYGRVDLLDNLLSGDPLVAPLARTAGFTAVLATLLAAPAPTPLAGGLVAEAGGLRSIRGVNEVLRRAAAAQALPSELGVPWATPPWTENVLQTTEMPTR
jgi:predicted dehydrogenase